MNKWGFKIERETGLKDLKDCIALRFSGSRCTSHNVKKWIENIYEESRKWFKSFEYLLKKKVFPAYIALKIKNLITTSQVEGRSVDDRSYIEYLLNFLLYKNVFNPKLTALNSLYQIKFKDDELLTKNNCSDSQFQKAKEDFLKTIEKYADVLEDKSIEALVKIKNNEFAIGENYYSILLEEFAKFPGILSKIISSKVFNVFINQVEDLKKRVLEARNICDLLVLAYIAAILMM
jgi:hypothetical protein